MGFALSNMKVRSSAFSQGGAIPAKYTGEGEDVSPPLQWNSPPEGTESLAVVCHDPDAPVVGPGTYGFVHWVLYNIPSAVSSLSEGVSDHTKGNNDFGKQGYGGPMPPTGHGIHHYYFWVLALDRAGNFEPGLSLWQFLEKVEPHVIGMNRIVGTYERK